MYEVDSALVGGCRIGRGGGGGGGGGVQNAAGVDLKAHGNRPLVVDRNDANVLGAQRRLEQEAVDLGGALALRPVEVVDQIAGSFRYWKRKLVTVSLPNTLPCISNL